MQKKAIIFDIDGTLTPVLSWRYITEYLGASWDAHKALHEQVTSGKRNHLDTSKELRDMWKAGGLATKATFRKAFYEIPLRKGATEVVALLSEQYRICFITGSLDIFAETIADRFGVEDYYYNTTLVWDGQEVLLEIQYDEYQDKRKVAQCEVFCAKYNLSPQECVAVGDSWNDRQLFDLTGNGIFIKSDFEDDRLKDSAQITISDLSELPKAMNSLSE